MEEDITTVTMVEMVPTAQKCMLVAPTAPHNKCIVCRLDAGYTKNFRGLKKLIFFCKGCGVHVHNHELRKEERRDVHEEFPGMTCHDILSSSTGRQIWRKDEKNRRSVATSHVIVRTLMEKFGRPTKRDDREDNTIIL